MDIEQRRIRNLHRHFGAVPAGASIVVGLPLANAPAQTLVQIGFTPNPEINTSLLPATTFGRVSLYNAEGRHVPNRNLRMETVTRSVYRTWEDWHGTTHSDWVDVEYRRYPRTFQPPPGVEMRISATTQGERIITTPSIEHSPANAPDIVHRVNLFLEIFGRCTVYTDALDAIIQAPVRRLNWNVLPPGQTPWNQLQPRVEMIIQRARDPLRPVIRNRLETINGHGPEFVAVGQGGFGGYVVFGFPARNMFLLESFLFGNATYGFDENWETLSQLSKAEILNHNLHTHRVIHRAGWHDEIHELFA